MTQGLSRLAVTLGVSEERLAPFKSYDDQELTRLDELISGAMTAEDEAFDTALEDALRFVPRPLRGVAKKMMLGGGDRG